MVVKADVLRKKTWTLSVCVGEKNICEQEKDIMYDVCCHHVKGHAELCASVCVCSVSSELGSVGVRCV